jgi:1-deoxy-D-xylulose-5-phosphate synthase
MDSIRQKYDFKFYLCSMRLLPTIDSPADLRKLTPDQLVQVAAELREFIIDVVSLREGHLGASLGVVELTLAIHYVFDTPDDQLIWDVGHQAYGHKIITGRRDTFHTNREIGGISGFPKRPESEYDCFGTGHSSTAISAALGMAIGSKLEGRADRNHIAVVGDASIAAGMAFEGLNHAGVTDANLLVILNDNAIGIDPSVGALKEYLTGVKKGRNPRQNNLIQSLNFNYSGPVDGHNIKELISHLTRLKQTPGPKFLHVITTKGKGMQLAEENQVKYHAPGRFDKVTGEVIATSDAGLPPKFQDVFGLTLVEMARINHKIVGITPAMPSGCSLKFMMDEFPDRAFDVGIAEQHAVTLAAGLATRGMVVYCNIYSTFLQRAYDQVIHDVALQNLPVIFCLDRAGIVGEDGPTHHGAFDLAYLNCVPNLSIFAPLDEIELRNILYTAQCGLENPLAIRYPRGRGVVPDWKQPFAVVNNEARQLKSGTGTAVLSTGFIGNRVARALDNLPFSHYHFGFVKPLDYAALDKIFREYDTIFTVEDGTISGGFGSAVSAYAHQTDYQGTLRILGLPDKFIEHGTVDQLHALCGLDAASLAETFAKSKK